MTTYLIRRILLLIPTLFGITLLTFLLIRLAPGNAALLKGGGPEGGHAMTAEAREQMMKLYDLDKPPIVAYGNWLSRSLRLDLGSSLVDHRPVAEKNRRAPLDHHPTRGVGPRPFVFDRHSARHRRRAQAGADRRSHHQLHRVRALFRAELRGRTTADTGRRGR